MADAPAFSRLPKMDRVLDAEPLRQSGWNRDLVKRRVREQLESLRAELRAGSLREIPDADTLAERVADGLEDWAEPRPRRVLNATGVILHTNLGRAPLSRAAIEAMAGAAEYCDLEVDMVQGKRGSRFARLTPLARAVLGAQDVHVVNNNAAALLLACTALGEPGGVVLSLGQMVEIGDGFRVATMAAAGGCRIVAVGSTNRTHLADYEQALAGESPECKGVPASALLWVHQSNFRQDGFVREVSLEALAKLARERDVPLIADLGSGSLGGGLPGDEPTILEYLEQGADLVLASGDKLLGGPQSGIIAGRKDLVHRCRRFPMARALRPDKTTLAALHATLVAHGRGGAPDLPLHAMALASLESLRDRAAAIAQEVGGTVVDVEATIGGGSLPGDTMASVAVVLPTGRPTRMARALRSSNPPVVGRIEDDRLLLDVRTIDPRDDATLVAVVSRVLA